MNPRQTALGKLLQERREAAGYSRTRIGDVVGIKPGTIEGWELGRVAKPPIHDVLRFAHFLRISSEEIEAAVFEDAGVALAPEQGAGAGAGGRRRAKRQPQGAVPLLEAAFRLFDWHDERDASKALNATPEQVRRWRSGSEQMEFADYLTLTSMIGVAAAEAIRGGETRGDLAAAAEALGLRPRVTDST
jgi:transcriptional regulator with XRE-family HTH domain